VTVVTGVTCCSVSVASPGVAAGGDSLPQPAPKEGSEQRMSMRSSPGTAWTASMRERMAAVDARHHSAAAAHVCVGALAASSSVATSTRSTCVSVSLRLASITRRADDEEPEGGNTWIGK
jgi:hypothetical protein